MNEMRELEHNLEEESETTNSESRETTRQAQRALHHSARFTSLLESAFETAAQEAIEENKNRGITDESTEAAIATLDEDKANDRHWLKAGEFVSTAPESQKEDCEVELFA